MHGSYDISNDDMVYAATSLVVGTVRWLRVNRWRPPTDHEVAALNDHYIAVNRRVGIKDLLSLDIALRAGSRSR
ncbi:hypothetical protein [Rhodococcus sp. T2V]|uniref:hypothetical protein n=1 Tax=Rhodococcus sp. T2V TaxID=3034164 RepID=UPI0023E18846|nr:hypothetical protein [Rhodococcus sp. T2V]